MEWASCALKLAFLFVALSCILRKSNQALLASITAAVLEYESCESPKSAPTFVTFLGSYEVFLSFRGPDTRKGFTDCLFTSLTEKGISVFRDNEELPVGGKIKLSLTEAIKQSKIAIPIISKDYASSKSCLMELQQMLECRENKEQMIIPIFYDVDCSDVKHLKGSFGKSFYELVKNEGIGRERINAWKKALRDIGEVRGLNLAEMNGGHHGKLIQLVVSDVWQRLKKRGLVVTEYLVGINRHVEEVMRKLNVDFCDGQAVETFGHKKCVVAICGMPGVGKTTLAKVVYNRLYHLFDGFAYLENVQERYTQVAGLKTLRIDLVSQLVNKGSQGFGTSDEVTLFIKHRFSNMKVLIFLDDVGDPEQLVQIAGELTDYGPGSRIIVTSRKQDVLTKVKVADQKYEVEAMEEGEALQLFCKHAFGKDFIREIDHTLSSAIITATGGLPLALEVVGSFLFSKSKEVWEDTLKKFKHAPHKKVEKVLKMCYEDLDENQKKIFLDIACFFIGKDKRIAIYMWEDCEFYPHEGIEALLVRFLVKVGENNELWMHDQLRDFGRDIVQKENPEEPCRRSRLWNHKEALAMLKERKGTEKVQALGIMFDHGTDVCFTCEAFYPLWNLRFLKLDCANIEGNLQNLLPNLRWLDWQVCPEKTLGLPYFNVEHLLILDLSWSRINQGWRGWELIREKAKKLKVLNLTGCPELLESPEFPAPIKLERLILEACSKLSLISPSISNLSSLVSLNMKSCNLDQLPDLGFAKALKELVIDGTFIDTIRFREGSMEQLETLSACKCERLEQIYEIDHLRSLSNLALDGAAIKTLPVSIGSLKKLRCLSLRSCQKLTEIPRSTGKLKELQFMDLSNTGVDELPHSVKHLDNLKVLKMEFTRIGKFPEAIQNLPKLEEIDFSRCWNLEIQMDCDLAGLSSLRVLKLSYTRIFHLPESICCLSNLQMLELRNCKKLQEHKSIQFLKYCDSHGGVGLDLGDGYGYISKSQAAPVFETCDYHNGVESHPECRLCSLGNCVNCHVHVDDSDGNNCCEGDGDCCTSESQTTPVLEASNSLGATDLKCYVPAATESTVDLAIVMPVCQNHIPLQYSSTVMAAAV
ncbi:disease resistance protein RPV1-like [Eucalyptus grandis]|uniref:disease resistance protein RPV1-like n=1 Tax=Eucalyptus grandis TaxID=71139 RepID=UPI00192ED606|nr:disease resistance protein RPV1-like [Eucalyptus grandis]